MKQVNLLLLIFIFFTHSEIISQITTSSMQASVNMIKPLSITSLGGEIDFREIILIGTTHTISLSPQNGKIFRIEGHPNRNIIITFNSQPLTNTAWVSNYGGTIGTINFNPNVVHTWSNSTYTNPISVSSGNSVTLPNSQGIGLLFLWVGGSITISENQPHGDYVGTFNLTVSY